MGYHVDRGRSIEPSDQLLVPPEILKALGLSPPVNYLAMQLPLQGLPQTTGLLCLHCAVTPTPESKTGANILQLTHWPPSLIKTSEPISLDRVLNFHRRKSSRGIPSLVAITSA